MISARWLRLAVALACFAWPASATAQSLYERGYEAWRARDYPTAHDLLLRFREEPYGRRPDVDFMLGTGGCRMAGKREWGYQVLDLMLYAYSLTYESRELIYHYLDRCRSTDLTGLGNVDLTGIVELSSAGMTGYGKTFYWVGEEKQPVASYPIHRTREIEREEFLKRLVPVGQEEKAREVAASIIPGAGVLVYEQFLLISVAGHRQSQLRSIGRTLTRFLRFLRTRYGIEPPGHYITVYLARDHHNVSALADKLHGLDASAATIGYAFVDDASLVGAVPDTGAGTILHEMFHLLVRARFGDIPQWLDEGIASLYEVSGRRGDRYFGLPNWRGRVLQELWSDRPSVETLIRTEWFLFDDPSQSEMLRYDGFDLDADEGRKQAANMATARYFMMFLEQRGQLRHVFDAMRWRGFDEFGGDARDHAVAVVERTLGRPLSEVDAEFADWFQNEAEDVADIDPDTDKWTPPG